MLLDRLRSSSRQLVGMQSLTSLQLPDLACHSFVNNASSQRTPRSSSVEVLSAPVEPRLIGNAGKSQNPKAPIKGVATLQHQEPRGRRKEKDPAWTASRHVFLGQYKQQNTRRDAGFSSSDYQSTPWLYSRRGMIDEILKSPSEDVVAHAPVAVSRYKRLPELTSTQLSMARDMGGVCVFLIGFN